MAANVRVGESPAPRGPYGDDPSCEPELGAGGSSSSPLRGGSSIGGTLADSSDLASLEEALVRFRSPQRNAVADVLESLEVPLDMGSIERRVDEYSRLAEALGHRLGRHLMSNYEGFMGGLQHVQQVDLEFALIGVMIKNNRRRLQVADEGIATGGLYISKQRRRRERIDSVCTLLTELREILRERETMEEFARAEKYHDALKLNARLLHTLRSERFEGTSSSLFSRMREDLRSHLEDLKQKLRERTMRDAAEAEVDFDASRYEEILEACIGSPGVLSDGRSPLPVSPNTADRQLHAQFGLPG